MKIGSWKLNIGKCKSILSQKGRTKLFCIFHFSLYTLLFPNLASGQVGTCEPALGQGILDAGNVRAKILNNGGLFWRGGAPVYEVPKDSGVNSMFSATILLGGLIHNELRTAATRYANWEFWPGPLDETGNPPTDCLPYDQVWEIRSEDIEAFIHEGIISNNLRNWPWQLGAPVIDGDDNPDNYNPEAGDLPELFGDQRLWWVMNDRGNVHESTKTEPIGIEVQASVHAFNHSGFGRNVTFYDYQLINKNSSDFIDAYFGLYLDVDLGSFDDDYIGSDSLLHLGYAYNADNDDEGAYGAAPPAIGLTFLKTAISNSDGLDNDRDGEIDELLEMLSTTSVMAPLGGGGGVAGDPNIASDYYNYMQAQWKDGKSITLGGGGRDFSTIPTNFSFSGDPVTHSYWSELNWDGQGTAVSPRDRWFIISTGPFSISSGDTLDIRFAIVWSRGKNNLDSVTELKKDVATLQVAPNAYYLPAQIATQQNISKAFELSFAPNFPNPFTETTTFRYRLPQSMQVRLAVYDILGREVEVLVDQQQDAGIYTAEFEAGALPSGIYMARIELDHLRFTKRMVLAR